jgi:hypothetical protein
VVVSTLPEEAVEGVRRLDGGPWLRSARIVGEEGLQADRRPERWPRSLGRKDATEAVVTTNGHERAISHRSRFRCHEVCDCLLR